MGETRVFRFESCSCEKRETFPWAGLNGFAERWEGAVLGVIGEAFQEEIAKERQIGQEVGMAGA